MLSFLSSFFGKGDPTASESLSVEDFAAYLEANKVVLLDVRTPAEYAEGHLPTAVNVDVQRLDFVEAALPYLEPGQRVALYCRSGVRSKLAMKQLSATGYRVVELNEGILAWAAAGKPIV